MANDTYVAARRDAQQRANETGFDYGLSFNRVFNEWTIRMLPMAVNRSGWELQCEVVSCEDLSKCQKGHGPGVR